jgi:ATP-dependent DNA helicase RecQ
VAEWLVKSAATGKRIAAGRRRLPQQPAAAPAAGSEAEQLREYLREWRRSVAKEMKLAAFIVLHDSSLDEICGRRPKSLNELLEIPGIGEKKAETYGREILAALERFRQGERVGGIAQPAKPAEETLRLLSEGKTLEEIAQLRGRQVSTVVSTVANLVETGQVELQPGWVSKERQSVIAAACAQVGTDRLKPLKDILPPEITYDEIKLVVGKMRREQSVSKAIPA